MSNFATVFPFPMALVILVVFTLPFVLVVFVPVSWGLCRLLYRLGVLAGEVGRGSVCLFPVGYRAGC